MKRIISFVFAVIYLSFTTGTLWAAPGESTECDSHVVCVDKSKQDVSSSVGENDFAHVDKASKHLTQGKVKTPRPGHTAVSTQSFIASQSYDFHEENISSLITNPHAVALYLRNGVLRL